VYRLALRLSALIHAEADDYKRRGAAAANADERERLEDLEERLRKWAARSEDKAKIEAALGLLKKVKAVDSATVDAAPHLLNVRNGTIDLRTGALRPHDPADRITRLIEHDYDPAAQAPRFLRFLREIMGETDGPAPVSDFLRRWYGYCATGETREHAFVVLWGDGGNGKSRLVEAIESVLGPYAGAAAPSLLMAGAQNRHETELADLFGRRLVTAAESSEGGELAEAQVKRITGGDRIKARFMRQDHFEFQPTHKVELQTNYKPVIRGQDRGLWRRVLLVPFTQTFGTTAEIGAGHALHLADPTLAEQLHAERAGILAWVVAGAREWYLHGLNPPDVVRAATAEYREEQDRVGQFIAEACELDAEAWALLQEWNGRPGLYTVYREWCRDCGYHALGLGKFKTEVERRVPRARWEPRTIPGSFMGKRATKAGVWGVRLKDDD